MKKSKIVEWTCDRCGKTFEGSRIFRPWAIGRTKAHIPIGILRYDLDMDLCSECANELAIVIDNYMRR